jgi:hypothetical protein
MKELDLLIMDLKRDIREYKELHGLTKDKVCQNCVHVKRNYNGFSMVCKRLDFIVSEEWFCADWKIS